MQENKLFYIKYPKKEIFVCLIVPLLQLILLVLFPDNILVIIWIISCMVFFGYHLFSMLINNICKRSYILFDDIGIKMVNQFNKTKQYNWDDYKGYMLVEKLLFLRIGKKNIKINKDFLENSNINEIIEIIEKYKIEIKY